MLKYIILSFAFLIFLGCKDDNPITIIKPGVPPTYDTVEIGSYFPAYPNSYWMYQDLNGDTIIHQTDSAYFLFSNYNPINNPYDTTKYYAPLYDSMIVKKYSLYVGSSSYHESGWKTILPDSIYIGNMFTEQYIWSSTYYSGKITAIDTTMEISSVQYDSVLVVVEYIGPSVGTFTYGRTYYAKNIGIIKTEYWGINGDSITSEEILIKYHIER